MRELSVQHEEDCPLRNLTWLSDAAVLKPAAIQPIEVSEAA